MDLEYADVGDLKGIRCLVAGGAGFIGSSLVRILLRGGADVAVLDNLVTGSLQNLASCVSDCGKAHEWHYGDIRDAERLARLLPGCDVVFNLACLGVRHSIHSPYENHDVNARGALTLLMAAKRASVRRFVHVSTSEVYGTARYAPMREDHPTDPHTVYGAGKLAGECYARAFFRCYGMGTVVIRPFNAYGPRSHYEGDSGEVIPRFILQALTGQTMTVFGDGMQTRDFTHVHDTAAAIARAACAKGIEGQTFNVGSDNETPILSLAELIRQITDTPGVAIEHTEPRPGDVRRLYADSSLARAQLGHRNAVGLETGLSALVEQFRRLGPDSLTSSAAAIIHRNWK